LPREVDALRLHELQALPPEYSLRDLRRVVVPGASGLRAAAIAVRCQGARNIQNKDLDNDRIAILKSCVARAKEFDEAEVLDRTVELFRARGFRSISFSDLTGELGVCRQSLYDTYGDKHSLFCESLQRYCKRGRDHMKRFLEAPGAVRPLFEQVFEGAISGLCSNGSPGCLMANAMVEMAPQDDGVRALAVAHAREIEGLFADRLCAAQRAGNLSKDKDPSALARYFHHTLLGLAVAARALGDRESLLISAQFALRALD
jgi:TetR/AcrR family transcriptional repressor of nem operon